MRILNILDEVLLEDLAEKKLKYKDMSYRHYPSSASFKKSNGKIVGACLRQLYYRATNEPEAEQGDVTGVLQAGFGDAIHGFILSKLAKSKKIKFIKEGENRETAGRVTYYPLTKEISFRLDGIIDDNGKVGGFELKTTQDRAVMGTKYWKGIKDTGPKEAHILQIICYMNTKPEIQWFSLVYVVRDTAYRVEFEITKVGDKYFLDGKELEFTFQGIVQRWSDLETHLKNGSIPDRDYKVKLKTDGTISESGSDYMCKYCPYASKCWSEPDARQYCY